MLSSLLAWINSSPLWRVRVNVAHNRFRAPTLDRMAALMLFRLGWMGREEFRLFRSLLRPGMTVVDIGANQGVFSLYFADLVGPSGSVIAFEPDPEMFSALVENVKANGKHWVESHNAALGSQEGRLAFRSSVVNRGDNRLVRTDRHLDNAPASVRVMTLDQVLLGRKVDFVKMDVQGWEGAVLAGMRQTLGSENAPPIHLELCPHLLNEAGSSLDELVELLLRHGYTLRDGDIRREKLDLQKAVRLEGALGFMNVLAEPPGRNLGGCDPCL